MTRPMLRLMKPRSVVLDLSIDMGGCFETSRPTSFPSPTYEVDGIHALLRPEPAVHGAARTATQALTNALLPYLAGRGRRGARAALGTMPDLRRGTYFYRGRCASETLARAFGSGWRLPGSRSEAMDWTETYRGRVTTADEAVKVIRSGDHVWIHAGCNNPEELVRAMVGRADELRDVEVTHLLTFGSRRLRRPAVRRLPSATARSSPGPTSARRSTRAAPTTCRCSSPRSRGLIERGRSAVDVALIHVSPPDEHGFCSYGVGVECTKAAAERARTVIALVNRQMPRSLGDSFIHVSRLTHVVEIDRPVLELPSDRRLGEVARAIGRHVADLIEDGATLQMGIGEIPDAVLLFLEEKQDLGVHTEMFSDGLVELFERGVITGEAKTLHRGKIVAVLRPGLEARPSTSSTTTPSWSSTPRTT